MKTKTKKQTLKLCGLLLAFGCIAGAATLVNPVSASAQNGAASTVTMVSGASARMDENNPGLKFKASVTDYDPADATDAATEYGMMILPAEALKKFSFNNDYHAVLSANGVTEGQYIDKVMTPYEKKDGSGYEIALSITQIDENNYAMSFVGIAYTKYNGVYNYTVVDPVENVRSIAYVAQMANKYYASNMTEKQAEYMAKVANPDGLTIEESEYVSYDETKNDYASSGLTASGAASANVADYQLVADAAYYNTSKVGKTLVSNEQYKNITEIQFDAYMPTLYTDGVTQNLSTWWGVTPIKDTTVSAYTGSANANLNAYMPKDAWTTFKYTTTDGLSWTLLQSSNGGNSFEQKNTFTITTNVADYQTVEGEDYYAYVYFVINPGAKTVLKLDNISVTADGTKYTEDFNDGVNDMFTSPFWSYFAEQGIAEEYDYITPKGVDASVKVGNEYKAVVDFKYFDSAKSRTFISNNQYKNITEIKFDVNRPALYSDGATANANTWWGVMPVKDSTISAYTGTGEVGAFNVFAGLTTNDTWVTVTMTTENGMAWTITTSTGKNTSVIITDATNYMTTDGEGNYYAYVRLLCGMGSAEILYFDNFSITADGVTYTENFNGGENTMFTSPFWVYFAENNLAEEYDSVVLKEATTSFADKLTAGTAVEYILSAEGVKGATVDATELPASTLALSGELTYTITEDKEFAIVLGGAADSADYLVVSNTKLAFYNGAELKKEVVLDSVTNTLKISVTAGGAVLVNINNADLYIGMGMVTGVSGIEIVGVGGSGTVVINAIDFGAYAVKAA